MKKTVLLPILSIVLAAALLLGLSAVLRATAEEKAQAEHLRIMQTLLPDSETFEVLPYDGDDANIKSVHRSEIGYVIETVTYGYAGEIRMLIGVNNDGRITGLTVREMEETLTLGGEALSDEEFLAQFLNTAGNVAIGTADDADAFTAATEEAAAPAAGEETWVDAITGATVTSKAIARCINSAAAYVTGADAATEATAWGG